MSEATMGMVVLLVTAIACALLAHWRMQRFWLATVAAAVSAVLLFQVFAFAQLGYLDPFFLIALVVSFVPCLIIAALVGLAFAYSRRARGRGSDEG